MNTETQFNDDSKDLPTFMVSGYAGNFTQSYFEKKEISDEEIEKAIIDQDVVKQEGYCHCFLEGAKWYREQLKKRQ